MNYLNYFLLILLSFENVSAVSNSALNNLDKYLFTRTSSETEKKGIRTDGFILIQHGEVAFEKYYEKGDYKFDSKHIAWSASKSITNALIGIAIQDGLLTLDTQISSLLPYVKNNRLTLKHVLEMSSCLEWAETYEGSSLVKSSIVAMLYGSGKYDMAKFVAKNREFECIPGLRWKYSSGDTMLLSAVLKAVYKEKYETMPWDKLFYPLEMNSATWERDGTGNFVTSAYFYASPRDFAKIGTLYLQDGIWNGKRLLPEGWVKYTTSPARAFRPADQRKEGAAYGAQWWLNSGPIELGYTVSYPAAPRDMYMASGHWGQSIVVIPSLDTVIVRTADDRDESFDLNKMIELSLKLINIEAEDSHFLTFNNSNKAKTLRSESSYFGLPGLSTSYQAKELCSCLFVSQRSFETCEKFIPQSPNLGTYTVDFNNKKVDSVFRYAHIGKFGLYHNQAALIDEKYGCTFTK